MNVKMNVRNRSDMRLEITRDTRLTWHVQHVVRGVHVDRFLELLESNLEIAGREGGIALRSCVELV